MQDNALVVGDGGGELRVWDLEKQQESYISLESQGKTEFYAVSASPVDTNLFAAAAIYNVHIYDIRSGMP